MKDNAASNATSVVNTIAFVVVVSLAFICSGVLCYLVNVNTKASVASQVNGAAGGWMILCFTPVWLGLCFLAGLSGYKLGGAYRSVGWLPLLCGLLGSLLINKLVV